MVKNWNSTYLFFEWSLLPNSHFSSAKCHDSRLVWAWLFRVYLDELGQFAICQEHLHARVVSTIAKKWSGKIFDATAFYIEDIIIADTGPWESNEFWECKAVCVFFPSLSFFFYKGCLIPGEWDIHQHLLHHSIFIVYFKSILSLDISQVFKMANFKFTGVMVMIIATVVVSAAPLESTHKSRDVRTDPDYPISNHQ